MFSPGTIIPSIHPSITDANTNLAIESAVKQHFTNCRSQAL